MKSSRGQRIAQIICTVIALGFVAFVLTRPPKKPSFPRWEKTEKQIEAAMRLKAAADQETRDAAFVRSLLDEKLSQRSFSFRTVVGACSGKRVLRLDRKNPAHQRLLAALENALAGTLAEMNQPDSPVRKLRRINEASRLFEDALLARLHAADGLTCEVPPTRTGSSQRSGYPDLRVTDEATGTVFYLDPKLLEQGSAASTFRSFYFEPKNETLKITDDAVHLLIGIEHDGVAGAWTFSGWRVTDLSKLRVRLKAEFQASNADLYPESGLSLPESDR